MRAGEDHRVAQHLQADGALVLGEHLVGAAGGDALLGQHLGLRGGREEGKDEAGRNQNFSQAVLGVAGTVGEKTQAAVQRKAQAASQTTNSSQAKRRACVASMASRGEVKNGAPLSASSGFSCTTCGRGTFIVGTFAANAASIQDLKADVAGTVSVGAKAGR